jgi:hypothetical protein
MRRPRAFPSIAVIGTLATAGAIAGIAGSAAAPGGRTSTTPQGPRPGLEFGLLHRVEGRGGFPGPLEGPDGVGPPVHADLVVPNSKGGFDRVTEDHGTFKSLSDRDLTITEGTKTATYKEQTISIPAGATVIRDGETAQLSDLKAGDEVSVIQVSGGTTRVLAFDPNFRPLPPRNVRFYGGAVSGVSGNKLTIKKGRGAGTQTVTIPSGATIRRNGNTAKLSDLKSGDHAIVIQTPKETRVMAFAPGVRPPVPPGFDKRGFRGRFAFPPGPPPGAPGARFLPPPPGWSD